MFTMQVGREQSLWVQGGCGLCAGKFCGCGNTLWVWCGCRPHIKKILYVWGGCGHKYCGFGAGLGQSLVSAQTSASHIHSFPLILIVRDIYLAILTSLKC